jgi:SAM-dependent methyltransferase
MTPAAFDEERYWSARLEAAFSLDGAGWYGLGEGFNRWTYRVRRRSFLSAVGGAVTDPHNARVLDVGSGTGFYVRLWHELGVEQVTGSDLTGLAVERLRARHPLDEFVQLDITEPAAGHLGEFDAVSAMDVLFHIIDDGRYGQAVQNLSQLLGPGGLLLLSENLLHGSWLRVEHQVSRSADWIYAHLRGAGLEVISRRPMFVLMNTPVDSHARLLHSWWGLVTSALHRWPGLGGALGGSLYPAEVILTGVVREGPSTELVVCRKRSDAIGTGS